MNEIYSQQDIEVCNQMIKHTDTSTKRKLMLHSHIYSIKYLNTVEETFQLDMRLYISWTKLSIEDNWEPQLSNFVVQNMIGDINVLDASPIEYYETNPSKNWYFSVKIHTKFNLEDFPVDTQRLLIKIRIPRVNKENIYIVEDNYFRFTTNSLLGFENSWKLKQFKTNILITEPLNANYKPEYHITIKLQRKYYYYLNNVILPNFIIILFSFTSFFASNNDLVGRMSIILVSLLTTVAFKVSISEHIPILSYETVLETYCRHLLFVLCFVGIEAVIVSKQNETNSFYIDLISGLGLICFLIIYHIYWGYWLYYTTYTIT